MELTYTGLQVLAWKFWSRYRPWTVEAPQERLGVGSREQALQQTYTHFAGMRGVADVH